MNLPDVMQWARRERAGDQMYRLIEDAYPICRSITGAGVRKTLELIQREIPLQICEVPTGTQVFDWTVPKEWNIEDAYIKNSKGERVVDFQKSNLHIVSYSSPVRGKLPLAELKQHLSTLPDYPDWIPYRTSYYRDAWGFCLSHRQLNEMQEDNYEVCVDSSLKDGSLTLGECFIRGKDESEILVSCHVCHPSLCNDNLSGIAVATFLAKFLTSLSLRYSYRFLFIPGTIGSITWLALHEASVSRIKHGLVLTCMGDAGKTTYKKSRRHDAEIDRAAQHVLKHSGQDYDVQDFFPFGYDERQYCSPGFDLPVGVLSRTPHGRFPEYHTSADDLNFVKTEYLQDSLVKCGSILSILENNRRYLNLNPKCEPQLGRRGLYRAIGGQADLREIELAMLWVLNLSDGKPSLLDIAERSGLRFDSVRRAADALFEKQLLEECGD
ncbi:MAG: DUF4910 domain-containing protein [Candidatus Acidiferrales bacterium]